MDKSQVTGITRIEGKNCVTTNDYGAGSDKSQIIIRMIEKNGDYVVFNKLTLGRGKVIETKSIYNRV